MEKIIKTFISNIKAVDEEKGIVEAVVSDETIDRYREIIKIDAWKKGLSNYKKHGVLLSSHNYNKLTNQIGVAESIKIVDKELVAKFKYFVNAGNEEADWGFFLAKQGLAAYSVGFAPKPNGYEMADWDDEDVRSGKKPRLTYTDVELLEVSQVTVPANPSALQKSLEQFAGSNDIVITDYLDKITTKFLGTEERTQEEVVPEEEIQEKDVTVETIIEQEDVMENVLKAIEELKTLIDTKFSEVKSEVTSKEDFNAFVDECKKFIVDVKEKETVVVPTETEVVPEVKSLGNEDEVVFSEEDENYLVQVLSSNQEILSKHISVQS
jgi:hypothetical protein